MRKGWVAPQTEWGGGATTGQKLLLLFFAGMVPCLIAEDSPGSGACVSWLERRHT